MNAEKHSLLEAIQSDPPPPTNEVCLALNHPEAVAIGGLLHRVMHSPQGQREALPTDLLPPPV